MTLKYGPWDLTADVVPRGSGTHNVCVFEGETQVAKVRVKVSFQFNGANKITKTTEKEV